MVTKNRNRNFRNESNKLYCPFCDYKAQGKKGLSLLEDLFRHRDEKHKLSQEIIEQARNDYDN